MTIVTDLLGGYTHEELEKAFNQVKTPKNWKLPIARVLPSMDEDELRRLRFAITFFTGSIPTVKVMPTHIIVTADGYYRTIGA